MERKRKRKREGHGATKNGVERSRESAAALKWLPPCDNIHGCMKKQPASGEMLVRWHPMTPKTALYSCLFKNKVVGSTTMKKKNLH